MIRSSLSLAILIVSLPCLLVGCSDSSEAEPRAVDLSFAVVNESNDKAGNAVVYGPGLGKDLGYGDLADGQTKVLTHSELKLPKSVNVDWDNARGKRQYKKVDLWRALGEDHTGRVTITLRPNNRVEVSK